MTDPFIVTMGLIAVTVLICWLWLEWRNAMAGWKEASEQRDLALRLLEGDNRLRAIK